MGDKDERGKALSVNVERGAGIFCKIVIVGFLSVRYRSEVYITRWQAYHHHQLGFL